MYARIILIAALVAAASAFPAWRDGADGEGTNWAVLVAGSNGYYNYRHQADIYHAYQILKKNGYPDSNIILFHYDDIANNDANPQKGVVINKSGGPNNYVNIPKDAYTGDLVTPDNFLKVIKGDFAGLKGIGSGKALNSTAKDNVFINFSDHGATGLIAFPSSYLYAKDLIDAINYMHTNNMYKQLVLYIEACESGSMFENLLPTGINAFATTASNAEESSYACYYDDTFQTYLGDVYSVNWMENSDSTDITTETLQQQFLFVQNETTTSHVMEYGELDWTTEPVSTFLAFPKAKVPAPAPKMPSRHPRMDAVDSRDVVLETLKRRLAGVANEDEARAIEVEIQAENQRRMEHDVAFNRVMSNLVGHAKVTQMYATRSVPRDFDCLRNVLEHFETTCFKLSDYSLKYVYSLVNLCEAGFAVDSIKQAIVNAC